MKNSIKIISFIAIGIFVILWINQFFVIKALYLTEKHQWRRMMDSTISHGIDSYVKPYEMAFTNNGDNYGASFDADNNIIIIIRDGVRYDFPVDSTETQESLMLRALYEIRTSKLDSLSRLDSILHAVVASFAPQTKFISLRLDSSRLEIDRFPPKKQLDLSDMIVSKNYILGFIKRESLEVYYNFPFSIFLKNTWNNLMTLGILTLLLIFSILCVVRLIKFMRKLSRYQEDTMNQIVHNWKTPLSSIRTLTELLQKKSISPTDTQGNQKAQFILEEIKHLQTGSQQILKTLVDTVHLQIDKSEFDLKQELVALIEEEKVANRQAITIELQYLLPTTIIYASRFHLICAIRNLLDDAIKYSHGILQISISCYQENKALVITIQNNGLEIPNETQKYSFNKYYQRKEKTPPEKRYDLGLNYVYNVVKSHKGKISVKNIPGKGSTFTIYLRKWKKL
ncbi:MULTISPECIES: sensor histidine kinase [Butyricimonas]|uniref:sensor histidine kinase n=1 Tax=Butyricimonas TaxID=574697 RepID=UPI0007FB23BF|nr:MULTISPECIES: HAMP domain-containing sensor histidine kinase [Butyricimonas]